MIKPKTTLPKLNNSLTRRKLSCHANSQNQKPAAFNTKGYFDPNEPYDQQYIQLKEKVFEKYRQKGQEYVMLDIKNINKAAFIHRGIHLQSRQNGEILEESSVMDKARSNLLKNYLMRKERREHIDSEKYYYDTPKINTDILQSRLSANSKVTFGRNGSSRVSSNSHFRSECQF